jgi:hypothetical protein
MPRFALQGGVRFASAWSGEYRRNLEAKFRQREIIIRAQETVVL